VSIGAIEGQKNEFEVYNRTINQDKKGYPIPDSLFKTS
jgi:hypothetical protein